MVGVVLPVRGGGDQRGGAGRRGGHGVTLS
jgi:hypothetical protein